MSQLRLKWMRLKIRTDFEIISDFIKNTTYSDAIGAGFTNYESFLNGISATFNKKSVVLEPVSDPFGEVLEFERVVFDQIGFSLHKISSKLYLLTFYNPPKSVKPFIDFVSCSESINVAYGSLTIDPRVFIDIIRESFGIKLLGISKVKVSNIPVNEKTKAALELSSSGDALHDLKFFVGDGEFKLDKIKATGLCDDSKFEFELSSSAYASVPDEQVSVFNKVIALIENNKII